MMFTPINGRRDARSPHAPRRPLPGTNNQIPASSNDSESQASIIEDILPSFQMHNFMLNRSIYDDNHISDSNDSELPDYVSEMNSIRSLNVLNELNRFDSNENNKNSLLNNVDKLKSVDVPIEIKIVLTKKAPKRGKTAEKESVLAEYRPGDSITGSITIKSNSDQ